MAVLTGCGSSALKMANEEIANFTCSHENFVRLESTLNKNLGNNDFSSQSSEVYTLFKEMNAKLAGVCPQRVLKVCSTGKEEDTSTDASLIGPINSFGVKGTRTVRRIRTHDGLASFLEERVFYSIKMDHASFGKGMTCYQDQTAE